MLKLNNSWSFQTIHLPNGNVIRLLQTNQSYFNVGNTMGNLIVKVGHKNPQNLPLPLHNVDPHLIHQYLGRPHTPPQTTARTVHALWHSYAAKSPLVKMGRPICAPKLPLPVDRSPNSTTCLIPGPIRPTIPNGNHIRSAVLPQCTGQTHRHTQRQTNRWLGECLINIACLPLYRE